MSFPRPYGRYLLDERIAMGGMAEIFRARTRTEGFEKRICIKRILPHFLESEDFVTMFRDEASLAARLQHANVVQVFDFGEAEGTLYLAMELVDGADLKRLLGIAQKRGQRFGIGHAVYIAIEMCKGLHHAHSLVADGRPLQIVHRDVSPHNVLISRAGEVKVTDFGIAKAAERASHTGTGVVKGKLAYMAPEQAIGRPVDHRADQFATAIVLWEMLTGARLFGGGEEVSILRKVMSCEVEPPRTYRPEIPEELEAIVLKALATEPDARYADMRELERALTRFFFSAFDDPAQSDVRALVDDLLAESGPARKTAVLPQAPIAEGAETRAAPPSTEGSNVFTLSGPNGPSGPVSIPGLAPVDAQAPTVMVDPSTSNPIANAPLEETGATRTVAPPASTDGTAGVQEPERPQAPAPSATSTFFAGASLAPPADAAPVEHVAPPALATASETPSQRGRLIAGGVGVLALGAVLGVAFALGGNDDDAGLEVVALPKPTVAAVPPAAEPPLETAPSTGDTAPQEAPDSTATVAETRDAAPQDAAPRDDKQDADKPEDGTLAERDDEPEARDDEPEARDDEPKARDADAVKRAASKRASERDAETATAATKSAKTRREPRQRPRGRTKGKVYIEMKSGWANAYLGSRLLCETPCTVELPTGVQTIRLEGPEGKEQRYRVVVKSDRLVRAVVPPFK